MLDRPHEFQVRLICNGLGLANRKRSKMIFIVFGVISLVLLRSLNKFSWYVIQDLLNVVGNARKSVVIKARTQY